jgi:8-amino-3,8-dideoxy-alpha-D-manno-octulosonate transaminase
MPGFELFGDAERKEVNEVLDSGILARYGFDNSRNNSWKAKDFEKELASTLGGQYVHAVSSGTAALTTAMMALGIGAGHEVIMPTFCFVACFEAIVTVGAIPVLVDIDETLTLDPSAVEAAITKKTKAVLAVHICGAMAQMDELRSVCDKYHLLLIEDASQAFGGTYAGKALGTLGIAGVYSFDFLSTITCGEGGGVITNDPSVYKRCDEYSDHGHDHLAEHRVNDNHRYFGANHRISELHAGVGLAQLRRLPDILNRQRRQYDLLSRSLRDVPEVSFRIVPDETGDTCTHLSFFLPTEKIARQVLQDMQAQDVPCFYWYESKWNYIAKWEHLKNGSWMNRLYDDHKMAILHYSNQAFPISDSIMSRCISVAVSLKWTDEEAQARGKAIAEIISNVIIKDSQPA